MSRRRERAKKAERLVWWNRKQAIAAELKRRCDFDRQLERQARIARDFAVISIGRSSTLIELAECSIVERHPAEAEVDYIERVKLGLGIVGSKAS